MHVTQHMDDDQDLHTGNVELLRKVHVATEQEYLGGTYQTAPLETCMNVYVQPPMNTTAMSRNA